MPVFLAAMPLRAIASVRCGNDKDISGKPCAERRLPHTQGAPALFGKAGQRNEINPSGAFCGDCRRRSIPLSDPPVCQLRVARSTTPRLPPEADIFVKSAQPWDHNGPGPCRNN